MENESVLLLHLADLAGKEGISNRTVILKGPSWSCRVGRGSRSGDSELYPRHDNCLFESRVMSREHAIIEAEPRDQTLCITDLESMHGTAVNGQAVERGGYESLEKGDIIRLGSNVTRGPATFSALQAQLDFTWYDNESAIPLKPVYPTNVPNSSRGFSVPDPSEDEYSDFNESDVEYLGQTSPRSPSVEIVAPPLPPRAPSVPNSVFSDESESTSSEMAEVDSHSSHSNPDDHKREAEQTDSSAPVPPNASANGGVRQPKQMAPQDAEGSVSDDGPAQQPSKMVEGQSAYETDDEDFLDGIPSSMINYNNSEHSAELGLDEEADETRTAPRTSIEKAGRDPSPSDAAMAKPTSSSEKVSSQLPSFSDDPLHFDERARYFDPNSMASYPSHVSSWEPPLYYSQAHGPAPSTPFVSVQTNMNRVPSPPVMWSHGGGSLQSDFSPYYARQPPIADALPRPHLNDFGSGDQNFSQQFCSTYSFPHLLTPKRKADQISSDESSSDRPSVFEQLHSAKSHSSQTEPSVWTSPQCAVDMDADETKAAAPASATLATSVPALAPKQERPNKRIKSTTIDRRGTTAANDTTRGSNAVRYAASALGWMAVGAVGAMWALVSLPEDFFA